MSPDDMNIQVRHLVAMGKEKGFVTCDEVNDILPSDIFSPQQIDEMLALLGEMNIEIAEPLPVPGIPHGSSPVAMEKDDNGAVDGELEASSLDAFKDPVGMYLRQIGSISLLSREDEIAIAKRIEEGLYRLGVARRRKGRLPALALTDPDRLDPRQAARADRMDRRHLGAAAVAEQLLRPRCCDFCLRLRDALREFTTLPGLSHESPSRLQKHGDACRPPWPDTSPGPPPG